MYSLLLIRHGQSLWNKENRFTGWTDIDLSDQGIAEAVAAGQLLKSLDYEFDIAFTSYLKRAIRTLWILLEEIDQMWIPVQTHWRLNERHYGSLTGLRKDEIVAKYGEAQVKIWRRSYETPPMPLETDDPANPACDRRYKRVPPQDIPLAECLKDTVARVVPYWTDQIAPTVLAGKRVLVVSHGNTIRALVKHLIGLSEEEILDFDVPTGVPLLLKLDESLKPVSYEFLGDSQAIAARIDAVKNQGRTSSL